MDNAMRKLFGKHFLQLAQQMTEIPLGELPEDFFNARDMLQEEMANAVAKSSASTPSRKRKSRGNGKTWPKRKCPKRYCDAVQQVLDEAFKDPNTSLHGVHGHVVVLMPLLEKAGRQVGVAGNTLRAYLKRDRRSVLGDKFELLPKEHIQNLIAANRLHKRTSLFVVRRDDLGSLKDWLAADTWEEVVWEETIDVVGNEDDYNARVEVLSERVQELEVERPHWVAIFRDLGDQAGTNMVAALALMDRRKQRFNAA